MKTLCEDLVNKDSNFADFVRFRLHTLTRTQQSLLPLWAAIILILHYLNNLKKIIVINDWNALLKKYGHFFSNYYKICAVKKNYKHILI